MSQHVGRVSRVAACTSPVSVCCLLLIALAGSVCARELSTLPAAYPDARGVTRLNVSIVAQTVRIPLATRTRHNTQRYFEYTGRFYALDQGGDGDDTGMLPGPCIHVVPGGKLLLQVTNKLGAEGRVVVAAASDEHRAATATAGEHRMYTFHSPNTTNVHFHGMHSDPSIDNPFLTLAPGTTHTYKLGIPRSHIPGFHWYHAHYHGSVYYQVMSGLFGPMIVDDGTLMTSPVHPFRTWPQHILLVHLYRLAKSPVCDGATLRDVDVAMATDAPAHPRIVDDKGVEHKLPPDLFLVNGQHQPSVTITQSTPTVLRLGYAAGSCYANVSLPRRCAFHVAAYDGVPLQRTQVVSRHWLYFTTATRIDVVVQCDEPGVFPLRLLRTSAHDGDGDDDGNANKDEDDDHGDDDILLYLAVHKRKSKAARRVHFPVTLPHYRADYLDLTGKQTAWRDISLSQLDLVSQKPRPYYVLGQGSNCSSLRNSSTCVYDHFMGSLSDNTSGARGFSVPLYTVLTAHIYGDPTDVVPHPFHFHVNHFRVISFEARANGMHANHTLAMYGIAPGQWRDTIPVLDGVTTVQWQVASYTGEVVYHCHNLVHEDHGMMLSYLVYYDPHNNSQVALASRRGKATPQPPMSSSSSSLHEEQRRRRGRAYYLILAVVFFVASGVALGWQWMRRHPHHLEAVALTRTTLAGQPVVLTSDEAAPLLTQA